MKKIVWENIKNRMYSFSNKNEIFELIEKHFERVEFVKDHIGVRDLLFFAERGTERHYPIDVFTAIDVHVEGAKTIEEKRISFKKKFNDQNELIMKDLLNFFTNTKRTLSIAIGFKETVLTETDELLISLALNEGKIKTIHEGIRKVRRFPTWFEEYAIMPEEAEQEIEKGEPNLEIKELILHEINLLLKKEKRSEEEEEKLTYLSKELCSF